MRGKENKSISTVPRGSKMFLCIYEAVSHVLLYNDQLVINIKF